MQGTGQDLHEHGDFPVDLQQTLSGRSWEARHSDIVKRNSSNEIDTKQYEILEIGGITRYTAKLFYSETQYSYLKYFITITYQLCRSILFSAIFQKFLFAAYLLMSAWEVWMKICTVKFENRSYSETKRRTLIWKMLWILRSWKRNRRNLADAKNGSEEWDVNHAYCFECFVAARCKNWCLIYLFALNPCEIWFSAISMFQESTVAKPPLLISAYNKLGLQGRASGSLF